MREKLWILALLLVVLGSQFGIAIIVTGLHSPEERYVGWTDAIMVATEPSADMRCEAAVRIWEAASPEWQSDGLDDLLDTCNLNGQ